MISFLPRKPSRGFTLAELLIALAILGVIATFTIPKILVSQANQQKMAVFKETLSTLNAVSIMAAQQGLTGDSNNGNYVLTHINAVKICSSDASTEGCWSQANDTGRGGEESESGAILHNGAAIAGLNDNNGGNNGMILDYNGAAGPNTVGEDQMALTYCYAAAGCPGDSLRAGQIAGTFWDAPSWSLYQQIFND